MWSETDEHRARVAEASRIIDRALASARKPYVAWSGGKDSGAMLHLVLKRAPGIAVMHSDYGRRLIPQAVYGEILDMAHRFGVRELHIHQHDPVPKASLYRWEAEGYDLTFVGIRAEEAVHRRLRIASGRRFGPIAEAWPVAAWTWMDVWAYTVCHGLPYLSLYDERAALIGYDRVRMKTLFDPNFWHLGSEGVDNVLHWRWRNG